MAKQDFETLFGSSISDSKIIMEKVKNMPNCFVGWVESYNADNNTVNIQPAIQQYVSNSDKNGQNYANAPLLANVWVVGDNTKEIKKGDKALCFVLDQKSNAFFKATYDSTNSLSRQTFKPLTNARKNITDCVAIILGNASQGSINGAVRYDEAQSLTSDEQLQARNNIGVPQVFSMEYVGGSITFSYYYKEDKSGYFQGNSYATMKVTQADGPTVTLPDDIRLMFFAQFVDRFVIDYMVSNGSWTRRSFNMSDSNNQITITMTNHYGILIRYGG